MTIKRKLILGFLIASFLVVILGGFFIYATAMRYTITNIFSSNTEGIVGAYQKLAADSRMRFGKFRDIIAMGLASGLALTYLISYIIGTMFSRPIQKLSQVAEKISEGDLSLRAEVKTKDEVGQLARSLNRMADSLSKGIEDTVKQKTFELSVLYEISNAISYTLDQQALLKLIMEELLKIVDYDICSAILFDENSAAVTIKLAFPQTSKFIEQVKKDIVNAASEFTGDNIRQKAISYNLIPAHVDFELGERRNLDQLKSSLNVPFVIRGKAVGMINVSSCKENVFDTDDVKLISTIANQASSAMERLQAVVKAEKNKMESMVKSMVEGVVMIDEHEDIVVFNPRGKEMLGFGPEDQTTSRALIERMDNVGLYEALQRCQELGRLVTKEATIPYQGRSVILRADFSPVKDTEKNIIGIVAVLRDITREKEVDRMKTDFISTVSHELRTPLSITKEGISLVLDRIPGEVNPKQERILTTAKDNIDRLARIINSLLDISKIESGKIDIRKDLVDIAGIARKLAVSFEPKFKEADLELKVDIPRRKVNIYADSDKIAQVFTNLIGNALKFTNKGHVTVAVKDRKDRVECSVSDTGKGVAKDDVPKLFSKFQQFGRVDGAGEKGTGLGLSIVKGIVDLHNGKIWADSNVGRGTQVTFTIPKLSADMLFNEYIDNGIRDATQNNTKMSVIMISIGNMDVLKERFSEDEVHDFVGDIGAVLNESLRRAGDVAIKDTGDIMVVLSNCSKENVLRVGGRLEQSLETNLKNKKMANAAKLKMGFATYPDDSNENRELIDKAKRAQII
ncbi:MAG: ATP-binding protein [Candidatus Omnitrophota bacterium]